jgi:hypothetical protein
VSIVTIVHDLLKGYLNPLIAGNVHICNVHICKRARARTQACSLTERVPFATITFALYARAGTAIHRWVSEAAAAKCPQITPTTLTPPTGEIGNLFDPMVVPLAKMAVAGFTWYQGEANECPSALPLRFGSW